MRRFLIIWLWFVALGFCFPLLGDNSHKPPAGFHLSKEAGIALDRAIGSRDEGVFSGLARKVSHGDLIAAFYGRDRARQRIALDTAGYLDNPWPVISFLAAFVEARQRQVASSACESLLLGLERANDVASDPVVPLRAQADQIMQTLQRVALNESVEEDLRINALRAIERLGNTVRFSYDPPGDLFEDPAPSIRNAALAMLEPPLDKDMLHQVARALQDEDPIVKGHAVAILCENALSHNVTKLSKDLQDAVTELILQQKGERSVAPVLSCVARFNYASRANVTDAILKHENPRVVKYWKMITEEE